MSKRLQKSKKYLIKKLSKVIYTGRYSMNYAYLYFLFQDGDIDAQRVISPLLSYSEGAMRNTLFQASTTFMRENFPRR